MKKFVTIRFKINWLFIGGLLIVLFGSLTAQTRLDEQALIKLYRNSQFNQIKQILDKAAPQDTSGMPYLFFKTLFIKDGALAKQNYERVYRYASNPFKNFAARRLHDYYYALGLYFKAAQFTGTFPDSQKAEAQVASAKEVKPGDLFSEGSPFKIQFGAFGSKNNAEQQAHLLRKQNIQAKVVKRQINNRLLYCVWVSGLKNIEETQKFAEQIKKQVHLDYRIIKP